MVKIRQAIICDLDDITKVEKECFPTSEAATKEQLLTRLKIFGNHFIVMEIDGNVIGFINGTATDEKKISDEMYENNKFYKSDGKYLAVFGLDVIEKYRRRGFGSQLMNEFIKIAKFEKRSGIILTCKKEKIRFYEKFRYKNLGISKSVHGGAVWYDMILEF